MGRTKDGSVDSSRISDTMIMFNLVQTNITSSPSTSPHHHPEPPMICNAANVLEQSSWTKQLQLDPEAMQPTQFPGRRGNSRLQERAIGHQANCRLFFQTHAGKNRTAEMDSYQRNDGAPWLL